MTFSAYLLRFHFKTIDALYFPPGKSGNILRGAFGTRFHKLASNPQDAGAYARIFEPAALPHQGPSGLADRPRPFVFRAAHLDGLHLPPATDFTFDLNLFDLHFPAIPYFVEAFAQLAAEGLGPGRGRAQLLRVTPAEPQPTVFPLDSDPHPVHRLRVEFLTPTELKVDSGLAAQPDFAILLARARDRIATLRALYGDGPLDLDYRAFGDRAARIAMPLCRLHQVEAERVSSRTGQRHPLGGFAGVAEYEGELAEFAPWLRAAAVTGVGRQTTWGKGALAITVLA